MKAAKIESCRDDGYITIEVELTSGREAGIVMPRNPTDQEVREIAVAVAVEAHVDKHARGDCPIPNPDDVPFEDPAPKVLALDFEHHRIRGEQQEVGLVDRSA